MRDCEIVTYKTFDYASWDKIQHKIQQHNSGGGGGDDDDDYSTLPPLTNIYNEDAGVIVKVTAMGGEVVRRYFDKQYVKDARSGYCQGSRGGICLGHRARHKSLHD